MVNSTIKNINMKCFYTREDDLIYLSEEFKFKIRITSVDFQNTSFEYLSEALKFNSTFPFLILVMITLGRKVLFKSQKYFIEGHYITLL